MGKNAWRRRFALIITSDESPLIRVIVFRVPTTHDVLTALFHPSHPKSHLDILNLGLLGLQLVIFFRSPCIVSRWFFFFYFAFWRLAYDAGLGWVLTKQSKRKWIVREIHRLGWLDGKRRPAIRNWIKAQLAGKMGKDYSFDVSATSFP
jgi:phosphatidylethanolamine N-methyltransferase